MLLAACTSQPCVAPSADALKPKAVLSVPSTPGVEGSQGAGEEQRAVLALGGQYCEFYLPNVEAALLKVPGVKKLDFRTVKDHVVVTYELGTASPTSLLNAINSVRGEGYYCKAKIISG
jgi:hypothetical protein